MNYNFVFEDNERSACSLLLKELECDQLHFRFAGTNAKVFSGARAMKRKYGGITFAFIDLSPNNLNIAKLYSSIVNELNEKKEEYNDFYIVPIIGAEYYIIKMLKFFDVLEYMVREENLGLVKNMVYEFNYSYIFNDPCLSRDAYVISSLEHVYKRILLYPRLDCVENVHIKEDFDLTKQVKGRFYLKDCVEKCIPACCFEKNITLEDKAGVFMLELPVCVPIDSIVRVINKYKVKTNSMRISELLKLQVSKFRAIYNGMGIPIPLFLDELEKQGVHFMQPARDIRDCKKIKEGQKFTEYEELQPALGGEAHLFDDGLIWNCGGECWGKE